MIPEALTGQQYCFHFEYVDAERRLLLRPGAAEYGALKGHAPPGGGGVCLHLQIWNERRHSKVTEYVILDGPQLQIMGNRKGQGDAKRLRNGSRDDLINHQLQGPGIKPTERSDLLC